MDGKFIAKEKRRHYGHKRLLRITRGNGQAFTFNYYLAEDDLLYLLHIESQIDKMEEETADSKVEDFFTALTECRHKMSEPNTYYEQLWDIGEFFQFAACSAIIQHGQGWDRFVHRAERLQNHVQSEGNCKGNGFAETPLQNP